jgi:hypothetical protein
LYETLYYLKNNPTHRNLKILLGRESLGSWYISLHLRLAHLAQAMIAVRDECWTARDSRPMAWEDIIGTHCFGIVDTAPIVVRRPKLKAWRRALYSGKYKDFVLKMQVVAVVMHGQQLWLHSGGLRRFGNSCVLVRTARRRSTRHQDLA